MTDFILTLHVKKKWFDLIKSGKKNKEFRVIKPYWTKRLEGKKFNYVIIMHGYPSYVTSNNSIMFPYKGFEIIQPDPDIADELKILKSDFVYAIKLEGEL